ncbi:hypothetical protein ACSJLP_03910 [Gordonia rhizosphera NBRC 16068]
MRVSALKKAGHLREELIRTNDFELYLRLAMFGSVARTNRVLGVRRVHDAQLSTPFIEHRVLDFTEHERAFESFFDHEGAALPDAPELRELARRRMGDYAYWFAVSQRVTRRPEAGAAFAYAADRRRAPSWRPPVSFLFKTRWLRSLYRMGKRVVHDGQPLPPSFDVPQI